MLSAGSQKTDTSKLLIKRRKWVFCMRVMVTQTGSGLSVWRSLWCFLPAVRTHTNKQTGIRTDSQLERCLWSLWLDFGDITRFFTSPLNLLLSSFESALYCNYCNSYFWLFLLLRFFLHHKIDPLVLPGPPAVILGQWCQSIKPINKWSRSEDRLGAHFFSS